MNSLFGYQGDPVSCAAYDLSIIEELEKEKADKQEKEEEENYVRNKIW